MTQLTEEQIFKQFFDFFDWAYEIKIPEYRKKEITYQFKLTWDNSDDSEKALLKYVLRLHEYISRVPSQHTNKLRADARGHFQTEFSSLEDNDRSRVLVLLHGAVEEQRNGITNVNIAPPNQPHFGPPINPVLPHTLGGATKIMPMAPAARSIPPLDPSMDDALLAQSVREQEQRAKRRLVIETMEANIRDIEHKIAMHIASKI